MTHVPAATASSRLRAFAPAALIAATLLAAFGPSARADEQTAYKVEVQDVTAKVGEHTTLLVTLTPRDGYRVLQHYTNRVSQFSSFDDGVAFEKQTVRATLQDEKLVFSIDVEPTKPGKHAINGLFRVGYIEGPGEMAMISVPLIATVTGTP